MGYIVDILEVLIPVVIGLMLFGIVIGTLFWHKYYADHWYEIHKQPTHEIDEEEPTEKCVGKLVRKVIDKRPIYLRYTNRAMYRLKPYDVPKDHFDKHYLTFETFEGYKSFTVSKETYHKYSKDTYGIITFQNSRFKSFQIRRREELNIPDRYDKD